MDYWLKTLGGGARGTVLRDDWKNELGGLLLRSATFPLRPGIESGDRIVYYAAGWRLVFAAGRATSDPYQAESERESHWPWRVDVSLPLTVESVHEGAPLDSLNVGDRDLARSIRQKSHIRLRVNEYEAALRALG